jgi:hypothetical protein
LDHQRINTLSYKSHEGGINLATAARLGPRDLAGATGRDSGVTGEDKAQLDGSDGVGALDMVAPPAAAASAGACFGCGCCSAGEHCAGSGGLGENVRYVAAVLGTALDKADMGNVDLS